jgi:anti-anti-sigma factor
MAVANAEHEATIDIRAPRPGVAHVVLGGEHDFGSAKRLHNILNDVRATCSHLVVDLSSVEFIDSSTIHVLLRTKKAATEEDSRFNIMLSTNPLLGTNPLLESVLQITGLLETLNRVHSPRRHSNTPVRTRKRGRCATPGGCPPANERRGRLELLIPG